MKIEYRQRRRPWHKSTLLLRCRRGRVRITDYGGYETRNASMARLITAALERYPTPDFPPLKVNTGDQPIVRRPGRRPVLSFCTAEGYGDIPIPDFIFDGWPQVGIDDYESVARAIAEAGAARPQLERLGWIGNCDTHPARSALLELGRAHPQRMEIIHTGWKRGADAVRLEATMRYISLPELAARYRYLIDVEGKGYSGRVKLLLRSGRPLFLQQRPWSEFFYGALRPYEHYIPVRRDLGDLLERLEWADAHPAESREIAANAAAFAREALSHDAALRQLSAVLAGLADTSR